MSVETQYRNARLLAAAFAEAGVRTIAVGAGSRSTALALAFADDGRFEVRAFVDERSAAFFALGAARVSGVPAVVVTTSGTAAANLLPAVVETDVAGVPLLCLTADRPPELHDVGATQTIEQAGVLSGARLRWSFDFPAYDEQVAGAHVGARAAAAAHGPKAGPVHLNLRFREPLTPSPESRAEQLEGTRVSPVVATGVFEPSAAQLEAAADRIGGTGRGLIHVGHLEGEQGLLGEAVSHLAGVTGFPVIVEATSRLRGIVDERVVVDAADAVVRAEAFASNHQPDVVIRIGRAPLTRAMGEWFEASGAAQVVIGSDLPWPDPGAGATEVIRGAAGPVCMSLAGLVDGAKRDETWLADWHAAGAQARRAIDAYLDEPDTPMFEGIAARTLLRAMPSDALLTVATSLPIRAVDSYGSSADRLEAYASRGASGIDGTLSAAFGAAAVGASAEPSRPAAALVGDLAFLHDLGGMLSAARHRPPLVTVVVDNSGGGIFEFLPQATSLDRETFDELFIVPHELDLMHAAEFFGCSFAATRDAAALEKAVTWAFTEGGPWVVRVPVRRDQSVEAHRESLTRAATAIDAKG